MWPTHPATPAQKPSETPATAALSFALCHDTQHAMGTRAQAVMCPSARRGIPSRCRIDERCRDGSHGDRAPNDGALLSPTKVTLWGKPLGKRQVQPSNLQNDCVYTCDQFAQQLKGMCAVTTSHCQYVQAALDASGDDHGCDVWSTACEQLPKEYAQNCAATTDSCVTCSAVTSDAYNLCTSRP